MKYVEFELPENQLRRPQTWGDLRDEFDLARNDVHQAILKAIGSLYERDPDCFVGVINTLSRAASDINDFADGTLPV